MRIKLFIILLVLISSGRILTTRADETAPGSVTLLAKVMNTPRSTHSATLLPDGTVLIAAGMSGDEQYLDSAEIYDPSTGIFTPTGRMTAKRTTHFAILLKNGKVLIMGGYGDGRLASTELYDPASKVFIAAGVMTVPREGFAATLLNDGQVLVAGGYGNSYRESLDTAELYNPQTNTFTLVGKMNYSRAAFTATLLNNGHVLVAGGRSGNELVASAELYDPATKTFTIVGNLNKARFKHAAARLANSDVLIVGGSTIEESVVEGQFDSAELYDAKLNKFVSISPMHEARYKFIDAVTSLKDGRILIAGAGQSVEVYDPARQTFDIAKGTLSAELFGSTVTRLSNGAVLIAGGYDYRIRSTDKAWLYQPE